MKAEQFLKFFEDRRFTVLLKKGSLAVEPFGKLNHDDHKTIAKVAADPGARATLTRLLCEREEALVRGLSPDQAHAVDRTRAAFDATTQTLRAPCQGLFASRLRRIASRMRTCFA